MTKANDAPSMNGRPVTDETIGDWVTEAEHGYDVDTLKRGRPIMGSAPARVAAFRLDPSLVDALDARAARDHTSRSQVVRDALAAWLKSA